MILVVHSFKGSKFNSKLNLEFCQRRETFGECEAWQWENSQKKLSIERFWEMVGNGLGRRGEREIQLNSLNIITR